MVRLIVPNQEGRVLLLQRSGTSHSPGEWCLPGGKVEYGQTMEEAVSEELREETGLLCIRSGFLFCQDSLPLEGGGMHCINLYFECAAAGHPVPTEEAIQFAWIGPQELGNYRIAFRNDAGLLRYWREKVRDR